ncbi:MAG: sporulation protein YqfD [Ruminococcaceae bacterium]|nr:sporulation protein YqfD [Oscillospiraceae bacterium]
MLLAKLLYYIRGYVVITVSGRYPERFLNVCSRRHILVFNVFPCSAGVIKCCVSMAGFKMLIPIARKTSVRIKLIKKCGLPVLLARLKKRKLLCFGCLLCVLCLIIMNQFVWKIEIVGYKALTNRTIMENLEECGLKIGAFRPSIDEKKIQNQMLIKVPELSWLWVDKNGSKVTVEVKERTLPPVMHNDGAYYNLVATKDGVIDSMVITSGMPMVSLGDTVRKGDVLVSGLLVSEKGVPPREVHAEGTVTARVWYEKTKAFSLWSPIRKETGEQKRHVTLFLFGKEIKFFKENDITFKEFTASEHEFEASIFGHYLGITLHYTQYDELETEYEKLSVESAAANGVLEIASLLDEQAVNAKLKERRSDYSIIDEDTIEVSVVAEYLENIAEQVIVEAPAEEDAEE